VQGFKCGDKNKIIECSGTEADFELYYNIYLLVVTEKKKVKL
jgi:hypothetical protein